MLNASPAVAGAGVFSFPTPRPASHLRHAAILLSLLIHGLLFWFYSESIWHNVPVIAAPPISARLVLPHAPQANTRVSAPAAPSPSGAIQSAPPTALVEQTPPTTRPLSESLETPEAEPSASAMQAKAIVEAVPEVEPDVVHEAVQDPVPAMVTEAYSIPPSLPERPIDAQAFSTAAVMEGEPELPEPTPAIVPALEPATTARQEARTTPEETVFAQAVAWSFAEPAEEALDEDQGHTQSPAQHLIAQPMAMDHLAATHAESTLAVTSPAVTSPALTTHDNAQLLQGYLGRLQDTIARYKEYPVVARRRGIEGEVRVSFQLQADGHVTEVAISGKQKSLRVAARNALELAQPLPLPPEGVAIPMAVAYTMSFILD